MVFTPENDGEYELAGMIARYNAAYQDHVYVERVEDSNAFDVYPYGDDNQTPVRFASAEYLTFAILNVMEWWYTCGTPNDWAIANDRGGGTVADRRRRQLDD